MKASKLVEELNEAIEKLGDLEVLNMCEFLRVVGGVDEEINMTHINEEQQEVICIL